MKTSSQRLQSQTLGNIDYPIAISGKARSGKNTVSSIIIDRLRYPHNKVKVAALADPMKRIIQAMMPEASAECLFGASELRGEIIAGDKYKDRSGNPLTYRQALIDLGSFGRAFNPDLWLNCLVEDANKSTDKWAYIISDVRMRNEFDFLKEAGFIMVRVKRSSITTINDVSETEQDEIADGEFDYILNNDKSIADLEDAVQHAIWHMQGLV
jgi:deoxynucleotide monophosphate kinase-like protein